MIFFVQWVVVIFAVWGGVCLIAVATDDEASTTVKKLFKRFLPTTETEKAEAELEKELDKRTAQRIREFAEDSSTARYTASRLYQEEMKAATPRATP